MAARHFSSAGAHRRSHTARGLVGRRRTGPRDPRRRDDGGQPPNVGFARRRAAAVPTRDRRGRGTHAAVDPCRRARRCPPRPLRRHLNRAGSSRAGKAQHQPFDRLFFDRRRRWRRLGNKQQEHSIVQTTYGTDAKNPAPDIAQLRGLQMTFAGRSGPACASVDDTRGVTRPRVPVATGASRAMRFRRSPWTVLRWRRLGVAGNPKRRRGKEVILRDHETTASEVMAS